MLLKTWFLLLYLFGNIELDFISFSLSHNTKQWLEILNLQIETLLEFKKCNEYRNYWLLVSAPWICLRFALDFSDIELLDIDLPDAD